MSRNKLASRKDGIKAMAQKNKETKGEKRTRKARAR